jgi:hypothetical protein
MIGIKKRERTDYRVRKLIIKGDPPPVPSSAIRPNPISVCARWLQFDFTTKVTPNQ